MVKVIILAALLAGQLPAPDPSQEDRAAVMSSLLTELAGNQRIPHQRPAGRQICVIPQLADLPLAGQRQPSPGDMKFDAPMGKPRLPWKPDTEEEARARLWWIDPDLPQEEKKQQRAIQDAALLASERPVGKVSPRKIEQAWLRPNQNIKSGECSETIELSEPNIVLGHAFIYVKVDCGALCGLGALYVMRRQDGHWSTVDGRADFIS